MSWIRTYVPLLPWFPVGRLLRLVFQVPELTFLDDSFHRRGRLRLFEKIKTLGAACRPSTGVLTASPARRLQAMVIRHEFQCRLGVRLTCYEAEELGGYSTVSAALYDFLCHCGCPDNMLPSESLQLFVPLFVSRVQLQHRVFSLIRKHGWLHRFRLWTQSAGRVFGRCCEGREFSVEASLHEVERRERVILGEVYKGELNRLWRIIMERTHYAQQVSKRDEVVVIAGELYLRALGSLGRVSTCVCRLGGVGQSEEFRQFQKLAFERARKQLEENLCAVVNQHK